MPTEQKKASAAQFDPQTLGAVLKGIDPSLSADALASLIKAAGGDAGAIQSLFGQLNKMLLGGSASVDAGQLGTLIDAIAAAGVSGKIVSLAGADSTKVAALAGSEIGVRYALIQGLPFAITGNPAIYDSLNRDGSLFKFDPNTGEKITTDEWFKDRAQFLAVKFNAGGESTLSVSGTQSWTFEERTADGNSRIQVNADQGQRAAAKMIFATATTDTQTIVGSASGDHIYSGAGDDNINTGAGDDYVEGGAGGDMIDGGRGNDTLLGGLGDDQIDGGVGDDTLSGGGGNDTLNGMGGSDTLNGDAGADTLNGGDDDDLLFGNGGADTLNGDAGNDQLHGGLGADVLNGGADNDLLFGDEGLDQLFGGSGNDYLNGGTGADALDGGEGNDVLEGAQGVDVITDLQGNNLLSGNQGSDRLTGGYGNNVFIGGLTNDTIISGSGNDLFAFNALDGDDHVRLGGGDDTLSLGGGIRYEDLSLMKQGDSLRLNLGNGDTITFDDWYTSPANQSLVNLQVIADSLGDYNASGTNVLKDNRVESFDFQALVAKFEEARAANPLLHRWSMMNSMLGAHLGGSDAAAMGGDLAYQYGHAGSLANISVDAAQAMLASAQLNVDPQALQSVAALQTGGQRLM